MSLSLLKMFGFFDFLYTKQRHALVECIASRAAFSNQNLKAYKIEYLCTGSLLYSSFGAPCPHGSSKTICTAQLLVLLTFRLTYMIFYNSVNVCLLCSCAKTSIVIHEWFHAGWEVQYTVHQMAEGGWTCTLRMYLIPCIHLHVHFHCHYSHLPNFCFVSSPLIKNPKPADSSFSIISSECLKMCTWKQWWRHVCDYTLCTLVHASHYTVPLVWVTSCNKFDIFPDDFTI